MVNKGRNFAAVQLSTGEEEFFSLILHKSV